ncbi:MAG: phosphoglycerate dehydrogenase [Chitinophagales bacterium]|nr:phosphoglycerate dehydrogenase [Chitinophagales bacterium]MCO5279864.1 phosphoglycerate dehydrogenase [Chitinophagales bacterium]OJV30551.1 MAG: D-3-phosphoglycerate dehydrogenase [Bacteroidetes bacterium 37-13]HRP38862.1 phosphoglycerate dehydrogenase [Chitinophagales bacterium]
MNNNTSYPKEKIKVLFLENISDAAVEEIQHAGYINIRKVSGALSEAELIKELKDVHLLGIRSKTQITEKVLQKANKLLAIGCYCIGINQVNLKAASANGVAVFNSPYSNTRSVAELVIGLSIMLIRKVIDKNNAAHKGVWQKDAKGSFELRGKTLGIIGYGNIGSQVSVMAEALGMNVLFYDVESKLPLGNASSARTLKELLSKSNIVTLHVPSDKTTHNLLNETTLTQMKKGAILINHSRGDVVDIPALKKALESGHLSGAAIDVFPVEPEKNGASFKTELAGLSNVILTPHVGGSTEEAQYNIGLDVTSKLLNYLERGITTGSHSIPPLNLTPQANTHRILHVHKNVPGVLGQINSQLSKHKINILGQYLKTNEDIGYVVLDVDTKLSKEALSVLKEIDETIKVRAVY